MMATLSGVLEEARDLGFLGPGPVEGHIEHANGFVGAVGQEVPRSVVDLGSGAGLPGLVLALAWPDAWVVLLDASERRAVFLARAVTMLRLDKRVSVAHGRAEEMGRDPNFRGRADLVVARSFGTPGVTAECAAPLLKVGGRLVVSEPPEPASERWPSEPLSELGMRPVARFEQPFSRFQTLRQETSCPERFPRRTGIPGKRPWF